MLGATLEQPQDRTDKKGRTENKTFVPNKPLGRTHLRVKFAKVNSGTGLYCDVDDLSEVVPSGMNRSFRPEIASVRDGLASDAWPQRFCYQLIGAHSAMGEP